MAYEYKKLSEVKAIDVADSSVNLIVETEDEIKKLNIGDLPIGQEQADWNEKDETKASFIKNKPDLSQVGGNSSSEVIVIKADLGGNVDWTYADGTVITAESLRDKLDNGAIVYIAETYSGMGYDTTLITSVKSQAIAYYYFDAYYASVEPVAPRLYLKYYSFVGNNATLKTIYCNGLLN